jgi:hypothetical protein
MLRHGCGYALANAGHDTRALQALGQGNLQHTVRCAELAPNDPEPAVSWLSGFRRGAHARPKTTPVHTLLGGAAATWPSWRVRSRRRCFLNPNA